MMRNMIRDQEEGVTKMTMASLGAWRSEVSSHIPVEQRFQLAMLSYVFRQVQSARLSPLPTLRTEEWTWQQSPRG